MKTRRRKSISLLIATSVFLCLIVSCGIPRYIVPTVSFTADSSIPSDSTTFRVSYKGDAVGDYGKVGLIILYYPNKGAIDKSDNSKIITKFTSSYKVSTYDGVVIYVNDNEPLYTISPTQADPDLGSVYAFEIEDRPVVSPSYTLAMSTTGDFTSNIKLEYVNDAGEGKIRVSVDDEVQSRYLTIDNDVNLSTTQYLNIYAAISVQSSQYSNIFWSTLSSVGTIRTE